MPTEETTGSEWLDSILKMTRVGGGENWSEYVVRGLIEMMRCHCGTWAEGEHCKPPEGAMVRVA